MRPCGRRRLRRSMPFRRDGNATEFGMIFNTIMVGQGPTLHVVRRVGVGPCPTIKSPIQVAISHDGQSLTCPDLKPEID